MPSECLLAMGWASMYQGGVELAHLVLGGRGLVPVSDFVRMRMIPGHRSRGARNFSMQHIIDTQIIASPNWS